MRKSERGSPGSGLLAIVIILFMLGLACYASTTLGDPSAPASAVHPIIQLPVFQVGDNGQAEATAFSARATADAIREYKAASTSEAQAREADSAAHQTQEAQRWAQESTAIIQETERAYAWQITGWTATADAVKSTSEAQVYSTASAVAATATMRAEDLIYLREAEIATATAAALQNRQRKEELDLQSKALTNKAKAIAWFAIPVFLVGLFALLVYRFVWKKTEYTVIQPASNGDKPTILHQGRIIDPDLVTQPVTSMANPPLLPLENQLQVKAGDQRVDLARSLPRTMLPGPTLPSTGFIVVESNATLPTHLLPSPDILDGEWNAT